VFDSVAKRAAHHVGEIGEGLDSAASRPATLILKRLRQIPVVECHERHDLARQQLVDQAAIEVEAALVGLAMALRQDTRPADRETVGTQTQLLDQRDVIAPAMVVIACDVAGAAVSDPTGCVSEAIPDRLTFAIFVPGPLDLVRSRSRAPEKSFRKVELCHS
jgi:hypothetical protein